MNLNEYAKKEERERLEQIKLQQSIDHSIKKSGEFLELKNEVAKKIESAESRTIKTIIELEQKQNRTISNIAKETLRKSDFVLDGFTTDQLREGTKNKYYDQNDVRSIVTKEVDASARRIDEKMGAISTDDIKEGAKKFYSDEYVTRLMSPVLQEIKSSFNLSQFTTSDLAEGDNLYFTEQRVSESLKKTLKAGYGISIKEDRDGALVISTDLYIPTFGFGGGSSSSYTDADARAAISETITGIDYSSTTGVFSLTSGYVIPTTTEESHWNTAYSWGDHAGLYVTLSPSSSSRNVIQSTGDATELTLKSHSGQTDDIFAVLNSLGDNRFVSVRNGGSGWDSIVSFGDINGLSNHVFLTVDDSDNYIELHGGNGSVYLGDYSGLANNSFLSVNDNTQIAYFYRNKVGFGYQASPTATIDIVGGENDVTQLKVVADYQDYGSGEGHAGVDVNVTMTDRGNYTTDLYGGRFIATNTGTINSIYGLRGEAYGGGDYGSDVIGVYGYADSGFGGYFYSPNGTGLGGGGKNGLLFSSDPGTTLGSGGVGLQVQTFSSNSTSWNMYLNDLVPSIHNKNYIQSKLGLGTTSINAMLHIRPSSYVTTGLIIQDNGLSGNSFEAQNSFGTAVFSIATNGNTSIGTPGGGRFSVQSIATASTLFKTTTLDGHEISSISEDGSGYASVVFGDLDEAMNQTRFKLNDASQYIQLQTIGTVYIGDNDGYGTASNFVMEVANSRSYFQNQRVGFGTIPTNSFVEILHTDRVDESIFRVSTYDGYPALDIQEVDHMLYSTIGDYSGSGNDTQINVDDGNQDITYRANQHHIFYVGTRTTTFDASGIAFSDLTNIDLAQGSLTGSAIVLTDYLQNDLVTNGDFTGGATGWSLGTGWAYGTNNVVKNADGVGLLNPSTPTVPSAGAMYKVQFTISSLTAGSVIVRFGSTTIGTYSGNGTHTEFVVATGAGTLSFDPTLTSRFTIDAVHIYNLSLHIQNQGMMPLRFQKTSTDAWSDEYMIAMTHTVQKSTSGNDTMLLFNNVDLTSPGTSLYADFRLNGISQWKLNTNGIQTMINGIATVSNGVPAEYATSDLTTQSAAIAATTLYAVPSTGAGMYRVSWVATVTRAASTSSILGGTNGFQLKYTDANDSVVKTTAAPTITSAANTTGTSISGVLVAYCKASTNLQYLFDYTSVGATTMQFDLSIKVEAL